VRKGERAIRILAPHTVRLQDEDAGSNDDQAETRLFFRVVPVFGRGQVDPLPDCEPAPLEPPREPITGDSHAHLLGPLETFVAELGHRVAYRETAPADGWCHAPSKTIAVGDRLAVNRQVAVLVHEVAHALGIDYQRYRREVAEVLVDTVTYVVCAGVGLDVGGEAIPYVAGWGEHDAAAAVTRFAETNAGPQRWESRQGRPGPPPHPTARGLAGTGRGD
jgi:antirestriction protein ArdC